MTQSVYLRGQPVNLVKRFYRVDPVDGTAALEDPDVVTWEVLDPDGNTASYVMNVDPEVTNPSVGISVLTLPPQTPAGTGYQATCESSGTGLIDSEKFSFDVIESGVQPPDPPTSPVTGPCTAWISGADVAACGPDLGVGSEVWRLDDAAYDASSLLYALSGRQFPGVCTTTRRPCQAGCGCWDGIGGIGSAWYWGSIGGWWGGGWGVGPTWVNDYGGTCGCGGTSVVRLPGYPIREILEVKIDGVVFPEFDVDTGARNWRLDRAASELTRMWTPGGDNPLPRQWPCCQNIALDDDQPGTFSIKYRWGADVPSIGRMAAAQLARELWLACTGGPCKLSNKITKVVRQGVTIERVTSIASLLRSGSTGLQIVDSFIAEYNPTGMIRRPAIFTPDDQQYAREVGQ